MTFHHEQKLVEEAERDKTENHLRLQALWENAEKHAVRKGGRLSMAWQELPGVSEDHLFKFHERHGIRVRITTMRTNLRIGQRPALLPSLI